MGREPILHSDAAGDGYKRGRGSWLSLLTAGRPRSAVLMLMPGSAYIPFCRTRAGHPRTRILVWKYLDTWQECAWGTAAANGAVPQGLSRRSRFPNTVFIFDHDAPSNKTNQQKRANSRAPLTINSRPRSMPSKLLSRPNRSARQPWRVSGQIWMHGCSALPR